MRLALENSREADRKPLTGEIDPVVVPWVDALVAALEADSLISDEFKTLWRRRIGR